MQFMRTRFENHVGLVIVISIELCYHFLERKINKIFILISGMEYHQERD